MSPTDHCYRLRPFVPLATTILVERPFNELKAKAFVDLMDAPFCDHLLAHPGDCERIPALARMAYGLSRLVDCVGRDEGMQHRTWYKKRVQIINEDVELSWRPTVDYLPLSPFECPDTEFAEQMMTSLLNLEFLEGSARCIQCVLNREVGPCYPMGWKKPCFQCQGDRPNDCSFVISEGALTAIIEATTEGTNPLASGLAEGYRCFQNAFVLQSMSIQASRTGIDKIKKAKELQENIRGTFHDGCHNMNDLEKEAWGILQYINGGRLTIPTRPGDPTVEDMINFPIEFLYSNPSNSFYPAAENAPSPKALTIPLSTEIRRSVSPVGVPTSPPHRWTSPGLAEDGIRIMPTGTAGGHCFLSANSDQVDQLMDKA